MMSELAPAAQPTPRSKLARPWARWAVVVAIYCFVTLVLPRPVAVSPAGWRLLGIFLATIAGLMLHPVPGAAIVLVAVVLSALFGGLTIQSALAGYGDPTLWLVMAAFFISNALIRTGLARRIALGFVRTVGKSSLGVTYALSLTDMVLAGIIPSNAARSGGVVLPIARSIAELYGSHPGATASLLGSFLISGVYQNICVTSAMFLTGQASNPLAAQIATETLHYPVNWTNWFLAGIVPGLCSIAVLPLVAMRINPPVIRRTPEAASFAASELDRMGPMSWRERVVAGIFTGVCLMWATSPLHHIDITTTALVGSAALLVSGILKWEDVASDKAAWDIFIWYGGLVRLGKALHEAGLTSEFARFVGSALDGAGWVVLLGAALLIYFYSHYAFASITAHLLSMFAPFAAVLMARGAPAGLVVFSFACFVSLAAGLTHYGTTPSPLFYGQNYTSFGMWWKIGFFCSLANLLIWCTIGFGWWKLIGLW